MRDKKLFENFEVESLKFKRWIMKQFSSSDSKILKQTFQTILKDPYILEQLVLEQRQRKINKILTEIYDETDINLYTNRAFKSRDYPIILQILEKNSIFLSLKETQSFLDIEQVRAYLYDLAEIFCIPIQQVVEMNEQFKNHEVSLDDFLKICFESGLSFRTSTSEIFFEKPNIFSFPQYVDILRRREISLLHLSFKTEKK